MWARVLPLNRWPHGKMRYSHSTKWHGCHPDPVCHTQSPHCHHSGEETGEMKMRAMAPKCADPLGKLSQGSRVTLARMQFESNLKFSWFSSLCGKRRMWNMEQKPRTVGKWVGWQVPLRFPGRSLDRQGEMERSCSSPELSSVLPSSRCKWDWTENVPHLWRAQSPKFSQIALTLLRVLVGCS